MAQVNLALVNYYFGSKEDLYRQVVTDLFQHTASALMAVDDSVARSPVLWEQTLRQWILRSVRMATDPNPPYVWIMRVFAMETSEPSGFFPELERAFIQPVQESLRRLLAMALPPEMDLFNQRIWASSIMAQCWIYAFVRVPLEVFVIPSDMSREHWVQCMADHIADGVMARIKVLRAETLAMSPPGPRRRPKSRANASGKNTRR
jgi:AcrR family transcriptional regulator